VLDAGGLSDARMLRLAAEVGYSETAFLSPRPGGAGPGREYDVRYFSAEAEVPFCGHATIATAVALAERDGTGELVFHVGAGPVPVRTSRAAAGGITAALTSVVPRVDDVAPGDVESALVLLGWLPDDLDPALPPRFAFAGARHLILGARSRERLAELEYDFEGLRRSCWTAISRRSTWSGASATTPSTPGTRFRSAAWSKTRPRARRRPPSAPT
jgi:PhzF family phenazine biosynthesis protein